jgi:hypothetical protein
MSCLKCKVKTVKECVECLNQEDVLLHPIQSNMINDLRKKKRKFIRSIDQIYRKKVIKDRHNRG